MMELVGFIAALIGAITGIVGSGYVSSSANSDRRLGFLIWIFGNPFNIITIVGTIIGLWTGLPLVVMIFVQMDFIATAYRGFINTGV